MQPLIKDSDGHIRFKANAIVDTLLEESQERGFGLNELAKRNFTQTDWEQFYQLIGYSLHGYHELSCVSDASALEATQAARAIDPTVHGCRDEDCLIHVGVAREPLCERCNDTGVYLVNAHGPQEVACECAAGDALRATKPKI